MNGRISKSVLAAVALAGAALAPASLRGQSLSPMADTVSPVESSSGCAGLNMAALGAAAAAQDGAKASKAAIGFSVANIDKSASPCTDFFQFADGNWKKANPVP